MTRRTYWLLVAGCGSIGGAIFWLSLWGEGSWQLLGILLGAGYLAAMILFNRRLQRPGDARGPLPQAVATVRWLTVAEGGREEPPPGPDFYGTAVFAASVEDAPAGVYHSLGLRYAEGQASTLEPRPAEVHFLNIDLVRDQLVPGATFFVMEPPKAVATATVTKTIPYNYGRPK